MRMIAPLLLLALSTPAHALTSQQIGLWADGATGLASDTSPGAHLGWEASVGAWFGPYDNSYAIGRFTGLGLVLRQDLVPDALRSSLEIEARRGMDLIAFGLYGYASAGAELVGDQFGAAGHLGVGGRYRYLPHWSIHARLDLGIGTAETLHGTLGLVVGLAWAKPLAGVEDIEFGLR